MAVLTVNNLSKSFGTRLLFEGVRFEVDAHDKIGLVGVNGCGKTTLMHIVTGSESADGGTISFSRDTHYSTMEQSVQNTKSTLFDVCLSAFKPLIDMEAEINAIDDKLSLSPADPLPLVARMQTLRERFEDGGGLTYKSRTRAALIGLGFTEEELSKPLEEMSGGQRNKAQLAKVLLCDAQLLILDEPTNHLDIAAIGYLEDYLRSYNGAIIVISHDRYFLDRVTNKTMELKNGRLIVSDGNYSRHLELQSSRQEILRRHFNNTQKEIRRIEGIIEQQRRFGRERNFITAASKQKQLERLKETLVAPEKDTDGIHFHFTAREVGGNDVLICEDLSKAYEKPVFSHVDIHIRRGERVFLLGANGCGKTTLLRSIMGLEFPDSGSVRFGAHVHPGYYDQHMSSLRGDNSIISEIWDAYPKLNNTQIRSALAAFLFRGDAVDKRIDTLSGGEKARVQLLKLMLSGDNLLLLDEPTNHLDISSREALEQALEDHEGTMLIVSHDRYLINRLADRVLAFSDQGLKEYIGGYDDYVENLSASQNEIEKESLKEKDNDYKAQKKKQSAINFAAGEIKRIEENISTAESEVQELNLSLAACAADYSKTQQFMKLIEEKQNEIDMLYDKWEDAQKKLEALQSD